MRRNKSRIASSFTKALYFPASQESIERENCVEHVKTIPNKKRVRSVNVVNSSVPDFVPGSSSSKGVQRRLGWNLTKFPSDNLSITLSSTMCSSDSESDFVPASSSSKGVKRRLGWSLAKFSSDNLSTTSSSTTCSSDNESDIVPVSSSSKGVQRRLGWSLTKFSSDNLSITLSSTMCSSDNKSDFVPVSSSLEGVQRRTLKNLTMNSPAEDRYFSGSQESIESENGVEQVKTRSNKKRDRSVVNSGVFSDFIPTSPSSEGVKRRLGWSRIKFPSDNLSTISSSIMCSFDNEPDFLPVSSSSEGVQRRLGWILTRFPSDNLSTTSSSIMCSSDNELCNRKKSKKLFEKDPNVLKRRQKQIDYGKNTKGYLHYLQTVPRKDRKSHHIFTPRKHIKYSRRSWDNQIKQWRKRLHEFDPTPNQTESKDADVDLSDMVGHL